MIQTPIIWNITNKCYYSCPICCLDANNAIEDLTLEDKLKIANNLDSDSIKIDVSGGEPLINLENLEILKILAKKFGKDKISITSTGKGLERVNLIELADYVSEVGFTYDFPREPSPHRPSGYNEHNLELAEEASRAGIKTTAQITLVKPNISQTIIEEIYFNLNKSKIQSLLLIKFSKSGRGISRRDLIISQNEVDKALKNYKKLEALYKSPKVKIIPFIKGDLIGKVFTSLNITNQGLLLSNPWSYELGGKPKEDYILGDLTKKKLSELAGANVYERFFTQCRGNLLR